MAKLKTIMNLLKARRLPTRPEDVDLRYFNGPIPLTDSYDGRQPCVDGASCTLVLYGRRIVLESWGARDERGFHLGGGGARPADDFWNLMHAVSKAWRKILEIGRAKFFDGDLVWSGRDKLGTGEHWDCITVLPVDIAKVLEVHPQYQDLVDRFGLSLKQEGEHWLRVVVSKRFRDKAA